MSADLLTAYDQADDKAAHLARLEAEDAERDARLRAPGALAAAALWYAGQGLRVFPCEVRGKKPLGTLARNGCHSATADAAQVADWWAQVPTANIGIACGHLVDVIDIDGPPGYAAIADHWAALLDVSLGLVHTGTGGAHIYTPADPRSRNGASRWGAGVDTRALGGYVIAPPSIHPNGRLYTWTRPLSIGRTS